MMCSEFPDEATMERAAIPPDRPGRASVRPDWLDGGLRGANSVEQTRRRKQLGMCPTCGEVKTHKPGLWKSKMPLTVSGLVYKGICLACNTLDSAKLQLCEPIDGLVDPLADMDAEFGPSAIMNPRPSIFFSSVAGSSQSPVLALPNPQDLSPAPTDLRSMPEKPRARELCRTGSRSLQGLPTEKVNASKNPPRGRGKIVHDNVVTASGVWAKGGLEEKSRRPLHEMHRPRLLPGYSVGDRAREEDMRIASREETVAAVATLRVGDCAWIRRSDGTWSYAVVESRSRPDGDDDGRDESVVFVVNARGSTKTVSRTWWAVHVRLPAPPDVLERYSAGDPGRDADMILAPRGDTVKSMSKIRIGDGAFVRRSDRSWAYAIVKDRTYGGDGQEATITFRVNERGSTKVFLLSQCGKFTRRVKHNEEGVSPRRK